MQWIEYGNYMGYERRRRLVAVPLAAHSAETSCREICYTFAGDKRLIIRELPVEEFELMETSGVTDDIMEHYDLLLGDYEEGYAEGL